ncbi:hypothetical protein ANO14919_021800 [Xylariales sp. No.14919]|nr:hypothetical protein ANO14919_021800 [Xylariales sp. No.14919]
MDNAPRRSPRKHGGDNNNNNRTVQDAAISLPDLSATPRAKRILPARTYYHTLRDGDGDGDGNDNDSANSLQRNPLSSHSTRSISHTSSRSTRSTSPVKRAQDLRKLQKPVHFIHQSPRDLAATIGAVNKRSLDLFKRINSKITTRRGILPLQLRDILLPELGYGLEENDDEDVSHMFSDRAQPITDDGSHNGGQRLKDRRRHILVAAYNQRDVPEDQVLHQFDLLDELETLLDIVTRTKEFKAVLRSEAAWNEHIHGRVLALALAEYPEVRAENVTRANIAKPFQPLARPELDLEVPLSTKMIDYALLLDPVDELSGHIRDFVARLQLQTFNQSNYEPLRTAPSGVFVETKVETKRYPEARAQLGIWLATWFGRVSEFHSTSDLVVPVLIATAEAWELWFAIDRRDYFDVCGPLVIGSTDDLQSIYLLRYCLSCLGGWMSTDFRCWVKVCVGT